MRRRVWILAGSGVVVVGLAGLVWVGATHRTQPAGCPEPTPASAASSPAGPAELLLVEEPAYPQTRLRVRVGQRLAVALPADKVHGWRPLSVSGSALRLLSSTGGWVHGCRNGSAMIAHLRAEAPGTAYIGSILDPPCYFSRPACGMPSREWRRDIEVLQ